MYTYNYGDVFKGLWEKNYKNGRGVLEYSSGARFEGEFRNDRVVG